MDNPITPQPDITGQTNPLTTNPLAADALAGFDRGYSEGGFFTPATTAWANRQPWYLPASLPVNLLNNLTAIPSGLFRGTQAAVANVGNQLSPKLGNDLATMMEIAPEAFRSGAMPVPEAAPVRADAAPAGPMAGTSAPGEVFPVPTASHLWDYYGDKGAPVFPNIGKNGHNLVEDTAPDQTTVHYQLKGDPDAYIRYEYDHRNPHEPTDLTIGDMMRGVPLNSARGTHVDLTDVMHGNQDPNAAGQMIADSFAKEDISPISIKLANIDNADTLHQIGRGTALENTSVGRMLSHVGQYMGASAEDFRLIRESNLDKPSIMVKLNYDQPEQSGVPVAATGRKAYLGGEPHIEVHRLDNFRDYLDHATARNAGTQPSSFIDPANMPTRWVPETQLTPF